MKRQYCTLAESFSAQLVIVVIGVVVSQHDICCLPDALWEIGNTATATANKKRNLLIVLYRYQYSWIPALNAFWSILSKNIQLDLLLIMTDIIMDTRSIYLS